jgi:heterodisulfide reductase subunit C
MDFVEILIMGKNYRVPSEITVQKALEYAGFQIIRGCGCRGGVCGACAILYRTSGSYKIETALACTTPVLEGMTILNLPYFPSQKAIYKIEELEPTADTIVKLYPEIARCMGCNTCTAMCPQEIQVMEVISAVLRDDIGEAAQLSVECVMCGLCAARCPGELSPHLIALLCRRFYGKYMFPPYRHVIKRLAQLDSGEYDEEMDKLLKLTTKKLREEYSKTQADKREI